MDLFIERRVFLHPNADADEYMTLLVVNTSFEPHNLERVWLTIPVTAAKSDVLAVSDGLSGNPEWHAGEAQERFLATIRARGVVPPRGQRLVGAHILCRNRCTVEPDRITFRDPFLRGDLRELGAERVAAIVTVVFPPDDEKRRIRAPGARAVLSRVATWEFMPEEWHFEPVYACLEGPPCPSSLAELDDGLADLHEAISRDACGEVVESATIVEPLQRVFGYHGIAIPDSLAVLRDLEEQPRHMRQHALRRALQECSRRRYRQIFSQMEVDPAGQAQRREGRHHVNERSVRSAVDQRNSPRKHVDLAIGAGQPAVIHVAGDTELRVLLIPSPEQPGAPTVSYLDSAPDSDAESADGSFGASDDFSEVHWRGHTFYFNRRQAKAVAYLYRAHQKGMPELHEHTWSSPALVDRYTLRGGGRAEPPFVLGRAEIAERGMATPCIVEGLDVVEDGHACLTVGAPAAAVDQLAFQRGEEALGHGIVVAVADAAP